MGSSSVEVTLLVDNQAGRGLMSEHGISVLIRVDGRSFLLDTGKGEAIGRNAEKLGVDLKQIDTVILSHGHYDHTGGLPAVIDGRSPPSVYFHPEIFRQRFACDQRGSRPIGIPQSSVATLERLPGRCLKPVHGSIHITDTVGVCSPIRRETDYEDTGGPFFLDSKATCPDPIEDDLALWIATDSGLVVFVGCCHAGIVNTLLEVRRITGESRVRAVVGGLHLLNADYRRLDPTMATLQAIAPQELIPCHCTGDRATAALESAFGDRVTVGHSGMRLTF